MSSFANAVKAAANSLGHSRNAACPAEKSVRARRIQSIVGELLKKLRA